MTKGKCHFVLTCLFSI